MDRERRQRLSLQWGALALLLQLRLALLFVQLVREEWATTAAKFGNLSQLTNRASQLKPAAFKFPFTWIYLSAFVGATVAILVVYWYRGMRAAMAPEPERPTARR